MHLNVQYHAKINLLKIKDKYLIYQLIIKGVNPE